jgi:hypothetical protein
MRKACLRTSTWNGEMVQLADPKGGWTPADVARVIAPFCAITFAPNLFAEYEPIVDEDTWIRINTGPIEELGADAYLRNLLVVIKTGGTKP